MMMMDAGHMAGATYFPVVFFDGEQEIDLGTVLIHPAMQFKPFQSIISQKIGISPHQITIYFEKLSSDSPKSFRRAPVTGKFNFAGVVHERSCFFWVVLKRSRRIRRRRAKQRVDGYNGYDDSFSDNQSPEKFVLLRRNPNSPISPPETMNFNGLELLDYADRIKMLERERERYITSLYLNSNLYNDLSLNSGGYSGTISSEDGISFSCGSSERIFYHCDVCSSYAEGETVPFHCCKNDVVTSGFRSFAGPIGPPSHKTG